MYTHIHTQSQRHILYTNKKVGRKSERKENKTFSFPLPFIIFKLIWSSLGEEFLKAADLR